MATSAEGKRHLDSAASSTASTSSSSPNAAPNASRPPAPDDPNGEKQSDKQSHHHHHHHGHHGHHTPRDGATTPLPPPADDPESRRLADADAMRAHWRRWGPYLSERAWATVREDYSHDGDAWRNFPFSQAHARAYRWCEDGIAGISDNHQRLCFALALWNEKDPILKERLFGVTGHEGNHGEDAKELYFYLDSTPTHSYMKYLYKYPIERYPYEQLVSESSKRSRQEGEYEVSDTGVFDNDNYFDVFVEYAKADVNDILIKITAHNRSGNDAPLHILPHLWFRNRWSWADPDQAPEVSDDEDEGVNPSGSLVFTVKDRSKPKMRVPCSTDSKTGDVSLVFETYGEESLNMRLRCGNVQGWNPPTPLFTGNDTNLKALFGTENKAKYCKDGINDRVVHNKADAVNPKNKGTKAAAWYKGVVPARGSVEINLRLSDVVEYPASAVEAGVLSGDFDGVMSQRLAEADEFYESILAKGVSPDLRSIQRQAYAGMMWSKQFYHYVLRHGKNGRNKDWKHMYIDDILSMPDKWEYPFFATWDLAFHAVSGIDPWFAKQQLTLMTREWYLHPNGQMPAYEWNFSDVNPPVHAWAAFRVFKIEKKYFGREDRVFLERIFQKLLLNFTWWVNRKDKEGLNVFEGGFLGLDNIAVFNRSEALPIGGRLRQADGTSWVAMFSLNIAPKPSTDIASKFFEHFLYISDALSWKSDGVDASLWDEQDGFFYDNVVLHNGTTIPLRVRSLVGLIPLFAVLVLEPDQIDQLPGFKRRMNWFLKNFDFTKRNVAKIDAPGEGKRLLLSLVPADRLRRVLTYMLDEKEFLSPYGIRSLSKFHKDNPYVFYTDSQAHRVDFIPAESDSGLFGGNSNWRGPIWLATTFLIIESLQRFHYYYGDTFKIECPTGSGIEMNLDQVGDNVMHRCIRIFQRAGDRRRPVNGFRELFDRDPYFGNYVLFYEYFHAETGMGLGASHQTGWTGLVASMILKAGLHCEQMGVCLR
ncbi:Six-hairpin glycosidase-like protein [Zopfochytrium polystomum]|nr:Six-hairpin glycosidase-like protein [Zopfochytrium polystomum]